MTDSASVTFRIVGGDGRQYGPVDLGTLQQWAREGRLMRQTPVWDSRVAAWHAAGEVAELAAAFGATAAPPLLPLAAGVPPPLAPLKVVPPINVLAICSFVLAWSGCCCGLLSLPAIVCGIVALVQIRAGRERGRGLAIAGIVLAATALLAHVLAGLLWLAAVAAA